MNVLILLPPIWSDVIICHTKSLLVMLVVYLAHITCIHTHRGIFPHAISFLRRAPVIGIILNLPGINRVSNCNINVFTVIVTVGYNNRQIVCRTSLLQ